MQRGGNLFAGLELVVEHAAAKDEDYSLALCD
jgi:hypothetical protein